jgi:hypothetical protein
MERVSSVLKIHAMKGNPRSQLSDKLKPAASQTFHPLRAHTRAQRKALNPQRQELLTKMITYASETSKKNHL